MRSKVLLAAAILAAAPGAAAAACPPELLAKMIDQGYERAEVLRLCGDGAAGPAGVPTPSAAPAARSPTAAPRPAPADPRVEEAFGQLRALTGRLTAQCASMGGRNARGTGPCDLADQYGEILGLWQGGQAKCRGGDREACRVLGEAAEQFLAAEPAAPGSPPVGGPGRPRG